MDEGATLHRVPTPSVGPERLVRDLPAAFRLQSIERLPFEGTEVLNRAVLFHERASLRVTWLSHQVDGRLGVDGLVSIRWLGRPTSLSGAIRISRLVPIARPEATVNLFETVPTAWIRQRALVQRARVLWEQLDGPLKALVNAVLWAPDRFRRYITGPSSLAGHHSDWHGNFAHSVEVAEQALRLGAAPSKASLLIAAGLLHDAGKAEEYRYDAKRKRFILSDRGVLIGHRNTLLEWLGAARAGSPIALAETRYLALLHAVSAAKGAPPWLGLREPCSMEATVLSAADRLSGQMELICRHAPREAGFGVFHKHLGGRPFVAEGS